MNRYSEYTPSAYDPMSFQEIAAVPMMKRQQHDANQAKLDAYLSEINKIDPLDVHEAEAIRIKSDLTQKINQQAEQLAREGFNNNTVPNVLKTNREIQDLYSPTGRAGKINAAKIEYNKQQEEFIKNAETQKIGRDQALKLWKEKTSNYNGYDLNNKILNVTPQGVASFQDYGQDLSRAHSILGETIKGISSSGHHLEQDDNGGFWEITKNGDSVKSNNTKQVEAAYKSFRDKWIEQNGEGTRYSKDANLGIDETRIMNDFNSMLKDSDIFRSTESANYNVPAKGDPEETGGTIISNDSVLKSDALTQNSYSDAHETIKKLEGSKDPASKAKLDDLKELRNNTDLKLKNDKTYNTLQQKFLQKQKEIDNFVKENFDTVNGKLQRKKGVNNFQENKLNTLRNELNNLSNQRSVIKDKYWKESSSLRHNYSYLPTTPKEESIWNLHNENVFNTLVGIPNLGNVLDLTSIYTTGGEKKNLNDVDVANIQDLLKNGDPKSFKMSNIKVYGDNKTPEITVTFNTKKGTKEYDIDSETSWNDEYGGEEKPVTVRFKLKKFSNAYDTGSAPGYKNLTGAIADFWKDKGGQNEITGNFQGSEVSNALIQNAYSDVSDKELYARAQTDSDARQALMIRAAKHVAQKKIKYGK